MKVGPRVVLNASASRLPAQLRARYRAEADKLLAKAKAKAGK
jgi:hypothetical protein